MNYDPNKVSVSVGGVTVGGESSAKDGDYFVSVSSPWYEIIPDYAKNHPDYNENVVRLRIQLENGLIATLSLFKDSESYKKIIESDPYDWTLNRYAKDSKGLITVGRLISGDL